MGNDTARRRIDLWLRSEGAMGLESVAVSPLKAIRAGQALSKPRAAVAAAVKAEIVSEVLVVEPQRAAFTSALLSREQKIAQLKRMDEGEVKVCKLCRLCETRNRTVFGEGDPDAKIFFIGEGPG